MVSPQLVASRYWPPCLSCSRYHPPPAPTNRQSWHAPSSHSEPGCSVIVVPQFSASRYWPPCLSCSRKYTSCAAPSRAANPWPRPASKRAKMNRVVHDGTRGRRGADGTFMTPRGEGMGTGLREWDGEAAVRTAWSEGGGAGREVQERAMGARQRR